MWQFFLPCPFSFGFLVGVEYFAVTRGREMEAKRKIRRRLDGMVVVMSKGGREGGREEGREGRIRIEMKEEEGWRAGGAMGKALVLTGEGQLR